MVQSTITIEMKTFRIKLAERLRTNLWVVPGLCVVFAALLASVLIEADRSAASTGGSAPALPWAFNGGAESARAILSTIAGSMITVAGTVYSITIVVLTLASVQFAPRVLGSFMRDRINQLVLGFFVATFTYCLLVLQAIRSSAQDEFVPGSAVIGGLVLAVLSVAMLIYLIDHIFHGIQVSSIIATVSHETLQQIEHLYPELPDENEIESTGTLTAGSRGHNLPDAWTPILATRSGYLQYVDYETLLRQATRVGAVLREEYAVGAFVTAGAPLLSVSPPAAVTPGLRAQLVKACVTGTNPTMQQDVGFGVRQIVDIALKAISPAVNDPTTALNCIDHLGAILMVLSTRKMRGDYIMDGAGELRIIAHERTFPHLVRLAFDQIRHYGAGDHVIVLRMLDKIAQIASITRNHEYHAALNETVAEIAASARRHISDAHELEVVEEHIRMAQLSLQSNKGPYKERPKKE